jgi:hypothetical protein
MPQLWKSKKDAYGDILLMISTSCLEKPAQKTLRLSHIYHSSGGGDSHSSYFGWRIVKAGQLVLKRSGKLSSRKGAVKTRR